MASVKKQKLKVEYDQFTYDYFFYREFLELWGTVHRTAEDELVDLQQIKSHLSDFLKRLPIHSNVREPLQTVAERAAYKVIETKFKALSMFNEVSNVQA